MKAVDGELPSFGVIAAALRRTTEHLAWEVVAPETREPDWNDFEWEVARAVAAMQGITLLLARQLRWEGPRRWQSFLASQRRQSLQRDALIASVIERVDGAL